MEQNFFQVLKNEGEAPIKNRWVRDLFSTDKEKVKQAVRELMRPSVKDSLAEAELITIVRHWERDEGYASLWAMVILSALYSSKAIPALLAVLDSDADYWKEAATEALEVIAPHHPEVMMQTAGEFIEQRMNHDPFSARLYAYSAIAAIGNEDAKIFLLRHFEDDDMWQGSIAHDLDQFDDRRILEFFKRGMQYAKKSGDTFTFNDLREAYCISDGDPLRLRKRRERKKSWDNRWDFMLQRLGKSDEELQREEEKWAERFDAIERRLDGDVDYRERMKRENAVIAAHSIPPFNLEAYLSLRARGPAEIALASVLRLMGIDDLTVEEVQQIMNQETLPGRALARTLGDVALPTENAAQEFFRIFTELWNVTPREELDGLAPWEMNAIHEATGAGQHTGRNDPCPCGSGKKVQEVPREMSRSTLKTLQHRTSYG